VAMEQGEDLSWKRGEATRRDGGKGPCGTWLPSGVTWLESDNRVRRRIRSAPVECAAAVGILLP
jgi:hypothetical protein